MIGGLLVFLAGVGVVRKARSARHGWSDTHIPIVVPPDGYDDTVATHPRRSRGRRHPLEDRGRLAGAEPAGVGAHAPGRTECPAATSPIASSSCAATDVRVGIYPSDVAVSTTAELRTPIRATILAAMASADAHLTTSAEAQKVEDRLK